MIPCFIFQDIFFQPLMGSWRTGILAEKSSQGTDIHFPPSLHPTMQTSSSHSHGHQTGHGAHHAPRPTMWSWPARPLATCTALLPSVIKTNPPRPRTIHDIHIFNFGQHILEKIHLFIVKNLSYELVNLCPNLLTNFRLSQVCHPRQILSTPSLPLSHSHIILTSIMSSKTQPRPTEVPWL